MELNRNIGLTRQYAFQAIKGLADWIGEQHAFRALEATIILDDHIEIGELTIEKDRG